MIKQLAKLVGASVCLAGSLWIPAASAGAKLQAAGVSSNTGLLNLAYNINNMINQNDLSANYVSGVTDFDSCITNNPTDANFRTTFVAFASVAIPVSIVFDLGGTQSIESMATLE